MGRTTRKASSTPFTYRWGGEPLAQCGISTDPDPKAQIVYYDSYIREPRRNEEQDPQKEPKRSRKRSDNGLVEFKRGDTVVVGGEWLGIIAQLWEVSTTSRPTALGPSGMRVAIHWFHKPSELAKYRTFRPTLENEIYYSISGYDEYDVTKITSSCQVVGKGDLDKQAAGKCDFICRYGLDILRDIYYDFDLDEHIETAMAEDPLDLVSWNLDVNDLDVNTYEDEESQSPRRRGRPTTSSSSPAKAPRGKPSPKKQSRSVSTPNPSPKRRAQIKSEAKEDDQSDLDTESDEDSGSEDEFHMESLGEEQSDQESDTTPEAESDVEGKLPDESDDELPSRSSRKRPATGSQFQTPRKKQRTLAFPTPHSKARLKKKRSLKIRPLSQLGGEERDLPTNPRDRILHVLHVGARPNALPCRETEYEEVLGAVLGLLEDGSGGCVYISGVPGTGKTATVYAAVRELKEMAQRGESNPFTYVEINGLRLAEAHAAYRVLWEAVSNHDVVKDGHLNISNKESLKNLTKHFSARSTGGESSHACVVLMDELDQLMTAKQDVVYNFFNWPNIPGSRLIIIAVANTHDLPERAMNGRVRSRLGMTRINFRPYTSDQLEEIVNKRIESASKDIEMPEFITGDAVKFASKKVASISGDARRVLDICRRAVENVVVADEKVKKAALIPDVKRVIDMMQNSPTAGYLRECSLHERILLAALLKCSRKSGVEDIKWSEVLNQHYNYCSLLTGVESTRKPSPVEMDMILTSLSSSKAIIVEEGVLASRKDSGDKKVVLAIEQTEVERVLGDIGGERWKSVLGAS